MGFAYLDDETLTQVRDAAVQLGFAITESSLLDLANGISPLFVGQAMQGGSPPAKLNTFLRRMNNTRALVSGEVPLVEWLTNAIYLAAGQEQEIVFRIALEQASPDGAAAPMSPPGMPAAPDIAEVPLGDEGLEIQIAEDDTIDVGFLHKGSAASRSVAMVLVHRHFGGSPAFVAGNAPDLGKGTSWLISPTLLITNWHVVNARGPREEPAAGPDFSLQGASALVQFDFHKASSKYVEVRSISCEASDRGLDFALLRLADGLKDRPPLRLRQNPILKPTNQALRERVNVLQHPEGNPMRLGFRDNFVVAGTEDRLSYLTDTAGGSSGSPICDDAWFVAALHRGYNTITGDPVMLWGKSIRQENYGTPIGRIISYLASNEPQLHTEIIDGQGALMTEAQLQ